LEGYKLKIALQKTTQYSLLRRVVILGGIIVNVLLEYVTYRYNMPIYLDTIGTMFVSMIGGVFPGIITAVLTNAICTFFDSNAIYYGFINALVAIYTAWFIREKKLDKIKKILFYILAVGGISGILSALIQWSAMRTTTNQSVSALIEALSIQYNLNLGVSFFVTNILLNILDRGVSIGIALLIMYFIPNNICSNIRDSGWKQRPLSVGEVKRIGSRSLSSINSLRLRITFMLIGCSLVLTVIMGVVGMAQYYRSMKSERRELAGDAAQLAAEIINPDIIDECVKEGRDAKIYNETEVELNRIRDGISGIDRFYIFQVSRDGWRTAFDISPGEESRYNPGDIVAFDEELEPYIADLYAGRLVEPIEKSDITEWGLTAYYPIMDKDGICRGYSVANVSIKYLSDYIMTFLLRIFFIMLSFYILVSAFGLWMSGTGMVYPINSIEKSVEDFINAGDDQVELDKAVRQMRSIDIRTGDEIEKMYRIICDMALNQTEKIRSVRKFSESTLKMQDGLIITMADLVENRDSDTGAHVQKTAEYVRIIVEGLEKKGYYPEKINSKFKSDVVRSAPLHDVGKINISDKILNKPGKLTDEEFEIMKTHTTAGKEIIEKVINTVKGEVYLKEARNMAAYHHERWDGKGYPEGLHGEVIPLSARIMAVADVFDALSSPRVYKPAFPLDKALSIIEEGAGTQFDPKCVEVFMDSIPEVKIILSKYNRNV